MGAALKAIQQRTTRRLPIRVEVEYQTTEDFLLDYTANVSLGGLFILTDTPLEVGTRFRFRLRLPFRKRPLETLGEVRWVQEADGVMNAGMGVLFDGLSGADKRAVERMMSAWEDTCDSDKEPSDASNLVVLPS